MQSAHLPPKGAAAVPRDNRRNSCVGGSHLRRSLFILAVAMGRLEAQPPAILQNGLFNSAGRMAGSLPGAALAPGSRFTIRGVRLGTDVRTTVVTIRSGGRSTAARLLTVNDMEIEGILPAAIQPGDATATVTRGGESSQAFSFRAAHMALGLYTTNRLGWGQADLARTRRRQTFPGAGRGRQAACNRRGNGTAPQALCRRAPCVNPLCRATKANQPGMDEIVFRIPDGVAQGCYVPVYAQTPEGLVSNIVTLPVARGGSACAPPEGWPVPGPQSGLVLLSRFSMLLETRPGDWETNEHETIQATFVAGNGSALVVPLHLLPPVGTCTGLPGVYQSGGDTAALMGLAFEASGARGLDAGQEIAVIGRGRETQSCGRTGWLLPGPPFQTLHEGVPSSGRPSDHLARRNRGRTVHRNRANRRYTCLEKSRATGSGGPPERRQGGMERCGSATPRTNRRPQR